MTNTILTVSKLHKYYVSNPFSRRKDFEIDHLDFIVKKGEIFAITGYNSSGKSTIAGMLAGTIAPNSGEIVYHDPLCDQGQPLHYGDYRFRKDHIRIANIDQIESFKLNLDVNGFLEMILHVAGIDAEFRGEIINKTLRTLHAPANLGTKYLNRLNKQEMSIVALAHAIILNPKVVIVDNLFAKVDLSFKGVLINTLIELQEQGFTIILTTSDLGIVRHISDRCMILKDGRIIACGNTAEVLSSDQKEIASLVEQYFGGKPNSNRLNADSSRL